MGNYIKDVKDFRLPQFSDMNEINSYHNVNKVGRACLLEIAGEQYFLVKRGFNIDTKYENYENYFINYRRTGVYVGGRLENPCYETFLLKKNTVGDKKKLRSSAFYVGLFVIITIGGYFASMQGFSWLGQTHIGWNFLAVIIGLICATTVVGVQTLSHNKEEADNSQWTKIAHGVLNDEEFDNALCVLDSPDIDSVELVTKILNMSINFQKHGSKHEKMMKEISSSVKDIALSYENAELDFVRTLRSNLDVNKDIMKQIENSVKLSVDKEK